MKKPTVAFDLDGTLIFQCGEKENKPIYEAIQLLHLLHKFNCEVFIWSGSGVEKATEWVQKLGLEHLAKVVEKGSFKPDITIDDLTDDVIRASENSLGLVNIWKEWD